MVTEVVEQIVHELALELSYSSDCRVLIETDRLTLLGRDLIELRVFLRESPYQITDEDWVRLYRDHLAEFLDSAGLELAVDVSFTPSQRFPSYGCWITDPSIDPLEKRSNGSRRIKTATPAAKAARAIPSESTRTIM